MKLKELNTTNCTYYSLEEFRRQQWRRGLPLSLIGLLVYYTLILIGFKPTTYRRICPCFEIGHGWGGLEMGWFFICAKDASEHTRMHEVGHGLANANVGGFQMLVCCIGSGLRYWYRRITKKTSPPYDSWWFENQATTLGTEYVARVDRGEIE